MKVLVLNGSPKGENSNTMRLTRAFLQGMAGKAVIETDIFPVYQKTILPCTGCFGCWRKTPGKCWIDDDMPEVLEKTIAADCIIWSFPLYCFGLPSQLKALMDRQLPMLLPFLVRGAEGRPDSGAHPARYQLAPKRRVMISTCGFYTTLGNYDALNLQLDRGCGGDGYETLYCSQGEVFGLPQYRSRTEECLGYVRTAGEEFMGGGITPETREKLEQPLYPRDLFERLGNEMWQKELSALDAED